MLVAEAERTVAAEDVRAGKGVVAAAAGVGDSKGVGAAAVDDGEGTVGCAGNRYEARVRRCDIFAEMYSTAVQGCQLPVGTCAEDHNHEMN